MTNNIIRVEPVEKFFSITWNLGRRCNYDCMYCPPELHDSVTPHHSLEKLKSYWTDIFTKTQANGLKYKISFTGGEVTGNKNLIPFLTWLRTEYSEYISKILLTTNGSATYSYYKKLFNLVDNISFSLHSEHINEQKFFDTIVKLHKTISCNNHLHVNIMNEEWNQPRIKLYTDILETYKISHMVNQIDYSKQTRTYPIFKGKLNLATS